MAEERLKIAVFVDFDNIQIGVKETLGKDFDVSIVLEALKERGEVVSKIAYGDWPRANEYSREMTQHAIHMVQRSVTPRGDKNGADINLALDALEMAFTHNHINTFVIVSGDSDFIALVEKLKQYDKRVFVVGGRQFTSGILQRNCHEFISYENLLRTEADTARAARSQRAVPRTAEARPLAGAMPNIQRALQILAEREVAPQLGLLKSTLLQLDATFSERDYGASSFLEFIQKLRKAGLVEMRRTDRGYLVEALDGEAARETPAEAVAPPAVPAIEPEAAPAEPPVIEAPVVPAEATIATTAPATPAEPAAVVPPPPSAPEDSLAALRQALTGHFEKVPNRPLYLRQIRQIMRAVGIPVDERSGFRGLLDLLHQAQREGWLRLHRDRKGVWRAFAAAGPTPAAVSPAAPPEAAIGAPPESEPGMEAESGLEIAAEIGPEIAAEIEPGIEPDLLSTVEADVDWESEIAAEEISAPPEPPAATPEPPAAPPEPPAPPPPPVAVEEGPAEPAVQAKPRKSRAAKAGTKSAKGKTTTRRRKTKEPASPA